MLRPSSLAVRTFHAWVWLRTRLSRTGRRWRVAALTAGMVGGGATLASLEPLKTTRHDGEQVLSVQSGVVEAPIEEVAAVLAKSFGELTPEVQTVEVDRAERTFAIQGGWWFRGEYQLHPHPRGTLVGFWLWQTKQTPIDS